jgi:hypothetical protein
MAGRGWTRAAVAVLLTTFAALLATASGAGADSTVAGQWRFDEAAGQRAIDDGPFGLDGRLGDSAGSDDLDPERIAGVSGGALRFDGRPLVRLPDAVELAPMTMTLEAVVRGPSSPGAFRYVVAHGAEDCIAGSYGLYTAADGGLAFYVFDGSFFRISAAAAASDVWNGAWHHVAGVYDGRALRLYVDGHPVGDPLPAPADIAYALSSSDTYFGTYQGTCTLPLRGDIDLVRLWHGPLSGDYVAALSDGALTPSAAPPQSPDTPAPETIPVAPPGADIADAPASRSGLAPAAPGTAIAATAAPGNGSAPAAQTPAKRAAAPGVPPRACALSSSVRRLRAGRRTTLTVRAALRSKPLGRARIVATTGTKHRRLASARTASNGRARLRLVTPSRGLVHLSVPDRTDCSTVKLTVLRARARAAH